MRWRRARGAVVGDVTLADVGGEYGAGHDHIDGRRGVRGVNDADEAGLRKTGDHLAGADGDGQDERTGRDEQQPGAGVGAFRVVIVSRIHLLSPPRHGRDVPVEGIHPDCMVLLR